MSRDSIDEQIDQFLDGVAPEGITARQLAKHLEIDESLAYRRLKQLYKNGEVQIVSRFPTKYAPIYYDINQQAVSELIELFEKQFPGITELSIRRLTPEAQETARDFLNKHFGNKEA